MTKVQKGECLKNENFSELNEKSAIQAGQKFCKILGLPASADRFSLDRTK